jgi:hypothetical protein
LLDGGLPVGWIAARLEPGEKLVWKGIEDLVFGRDWEVVNRDEHLLTLNVDRVSALPVNQIVMFEKKLILPGLYEGLDVVIKPDAG